MSFDIVANEEWQIAVIDASNVWGDVYGVELKNIRFDPFEGNVTEGDAMVHIKFLNVYPFELEALAQELLVE